MGLMASVELNRRKKKKNIPAIGYGTSCKTKMHVTSTLRALCTNFIYILDTTLGTYSESNSMCRVPFTSRETRWWEWLHFGDDSDENKTTFYYVQKAPEAHNKNNNIKKSGSMNCFVFVVWFWASQSHDFFSFVHLFGFV